MKLYRTKDGQRRIHIEESDSYYATDDNGVDFFPTQEQVEMIAKEWHGDAS